MPGATQSEGRLRVGGVRGDQVARRPGGEPAEGAGCGPDEVVVVGCEGERTLGVVDRRGRVAVPECERGSIHLHHCRQRRVRIDVHHDEPGGGSTGQTPSFTWTARHVRQTPLEGGELRHLGQRADEPDREDRAPLEDLVGDGLDPAGQRARDGPDSSPATPSSHEIGGPLGVLRRECVLDGLGQVALGLQPSAGAPVQLGHLGRTRLGQVHPQDLAEQVVVPVPPAPVVERHDEQVGPLDSTSRVVPPVCPVTASHSGPVSRCSTDVSSRNLRTSSGCRARTSSTR